MREDKDEAKAKIGKEAAVTFTGRREYLVFCGLDNVHILSAYRHHYGVTLFIT